jgi:eukaryotic-like serine/threonine-protein kinase
MDSHQWNRIDELLQSALERPTGERDEFLRTACAGDGTLEREVRSLLSARQEAGSFLESPAIQVAAQALANQQPEGAQGRNPMPMPARPVPATIGQYRIVRLLGEGGMGVVYEAAQENPQRTVALKVVKPGLDSSLLRRFEHESQALARLQHPGIAHIYEAGVADTGFGPQPYFAMEFIRGQALRDYVETHRLSVRERVALMIKICRAVHHAHQRGLIHRDLKPGNILVDDTGEPKILDFGVARVTDTEAQVTRQTDVGQLVGTLEYMSPEQVLADPEEVDTRSDVYALGVILYEMLAGRRPYKLSRQLPEAARAIREEDPAPLSSVSRDYRGDLETIAAKALEKDKERRYGSAAALAADMERYLTDQPIAARPPSAIYHLRKFARRNKVLVGSIAAVFVALTVGIVASSWEAVRANRAQRAAQLEAATAKAVTDFLQKDLLAQAGASAQASPDSKPDPDIKVRTALDRAAARIEDKFHQQPLVEASLRETIGDTYEDLGLYPQAQRQAESALELRRHALGDAHPDTLRSMNKLAGMYRDGALYVQAEDLFSKALDGERRVLGAEHPDTLETMLDLGTLKRIQGDCPQAEALMTKVMEIERRVKGEEHADPLAMDQLALVYEQEGKYARADALLNRSVEIRRSHQGQEHPETLYSMNELAGVYFREGKYREAEKLYESVFEIRRRVSGPEHPDTLLCMGNLANLYLKESKYTEAKTLLTEALTMDRRVLGEEHIYTLMVMNNLGVLYRNQGRYAQAEPILTEAVEVRRRVEGAEHPDTLFSMTTLGLLYLYEGKYGQAETMLTRVLELRRRLLGEEHPDTLTSRNNLALLYERQGRSEQAADLFTKVLESQRRVLGRDHPDTLRVLDALGRIQLAERHYAEAEPFLREALVGQEKSSPDSWERFDSQSMLGAALVGQKNYGEAEPLLLSGYEGLVQRQASVPQGSRLAVVQAGARIVQLYERWRKPEREAEWRTKTRQLATDQ